MDINKEMITTFKGLKYFFLIIAFGITLLFTITDLISNKISKETIIEIGLLVQIILYAYGDISNKAWPIIIAFIMAMITIIDMINCC